MKHVVITGASAGIGLASARLFAEKGYKVTLLARRQELLEQIEKELGSSTQAISLDVSDESRVKKVFRSLIEKAPIDLLINNAGAAFGLDLAQNASSQDWDRCIDLNIKGVLHCTKAVLPHMVERNQGHIIQLGSVAGTYPYPGANVYGATKAFIRQFSLNLRADLLGTWVRVSCIEPGLVAETEFSQVRFKGDLLRAQKVYERTQALKPEDIAKILLFTAEVPDHVNINTVEVMPTLQAFSPLAVHRDSI